MIMPEHSTESFFASSPFEATDTSLDPVNDKTEGVQYAHGYKPDDKAYQHTNRLFHREIRDSFPVVNLDPVKGRIPLVADMVPGTNLRDPVRISLGTGRLKYPLR
jgi:hypothetical protein